MMTSITKKNQSGMPGAGGMKNMDDARLKDELDEIIKQIDKIVKKVEASPEFSGKKTPDDESESDIKSEASD